jgi:hypothetical protein
VFLRIILVVLHSSQLAETGLLKKQRAHANAKSTEVVVEDMVGKVARENSS